MQGEISRAIVPIRKQSDESYSAFFLITTYVARTNDELAALEGRIDSFGFYPYRLESGQDTELASDKKKMDDLFSNLIAERLRNW